MHIWFLILDQCFGNIFRGFVGGKDVKSIDYWSE